MGLWSFLKRLLFGSSPPQHAKSRETSRRRTPASAARKRPKLTKLRFVSAASDKVPLFETETLPYKFARLNPGTGHYFDLSHDGHVESLEEWELPVLETPEELAHWLERPLGEIAWLTGRFPTSDGSDTSHYVYQWKQKRAGGERLIESPKSKLKAVQQKILHGILNQVPVHRNCHGFTVGRSILSNAQPHVGKRVILKFDLADFYPSVTFSRVVAIFRSMGYNREVAIWLGHLTTNRLPATIPFPKSGPATLHRYQKRHLPQGAPTSPALANLSAFSLDLRLSGLARSFGATYTRYADDLTFSGPQELISGLRIVIPLVEKVIRSERFHVHKEKRKVLRNNQRQTVTGVVVNERPNVSRKDFDRLKAILYNCRKHGPDSQNHEKHDDFPAVLRGRIAHVRQLNPARGEKLLALFREINW